MPSGCVRVGDRVADVEVVDARDADDVAGRGLLDLDALESAKRQELRQAQPGVDAAVARDLGDRRVDRDVPRKTRPIPMRPTYLL